MDKQTELLGNNFKLQLLRIIWAEYSSKGANCVEMQNIKRYSYFHSDLL